MLAGAAGPGYVVGVIAQGGLARGCDTVPGDHGGATGVPPHAGPEGETCECTNGSVDASPGGAPEATAARTAAATPSTPAEPPMTAQVSAAPQATSRDRKSTRLNSSHVAISYAGFCMKKKC